MTDKPGRCSVPGCESTMVRNQATGYCPKHYERTRKYGDPSVVHGTLGMSLEQKLTYYGWEVVESGCWMYSGNKSSVGYGTLYCGKSWLAHRAAYEAWIGPIPVGLVVRHKCDNPPCINPAHLETGTQADNVRDRVKRGRSRSVRGEEHGLAILKESDIRAIRERYAAGGISQQAIADRIGVSREHVRDIILRKRWTHIA